MRVWWSCVLSTFRSFPFASPSVKRLERLGGKEKIKMAPGIERIHTDICIYTYIYTVAETQLAPSFARTVEIEARGGEGEVGLKLLKANLSFVRIHLRTHFYCIRATSTFADVAIVSAGTSRKFPIGSIGFRATLRGIISLASERAPLSARRTGSVIV